MNRDRRAGLVSARIALTILLRDTEEELAESNEHNYAFLQERVLTQKQGLWTVEELLAEDIQERLK